MIPRNEIIGIDINDDWKSIVRQLSHSPHGRIVLYRDSLDDAIGMLRVREAAIDGRKKRVHQRDHVTRRRRNLLRSGRHATQHQLIKFQRNKKSGHGRQ